MDIDEPNPIAGTKKKSPPLINRSIYSQQKMIYIQSRKDTRTVINFGTLSLLVLCVLHRCTGYKKNQNGQE
jgi:hypothetical protein